MPIYAYKCGSCGFAKDVLQKMSDDPLTECPACGASSFSKQLTAAGFQLKGSGWYVTDFRGDTSGAAKKPGESAPADAKPAEGKASEPKTADSKPSESKSSESTASAAPAKSDPPKATDSAIRPARAGQ